MEFFGDKYDNQGGGVAATRLFGYLDIEDVKAHLSTLEDSENTAHLRKALSDLRGSMVGCYSVIGVRQFDNCYNKGVSIPHIGYDSRHDRAVMHEPGQTTAKRYFGIYVTLAGAAKLPDVFGGYELLGGKARIYLTGGTYQWMGTHPLVKADDDFEDFQ